VMPPISNTSAQLYVTDDTAHFAAVRLMLT
jgi:hypothetical protein